MIAFAVQIFQFVARPDDVDNYGFNFTLTPEAFPKPMEGAK